MDNDQLFEQALADPECMILFKRPREEALERIENRWPVKLETDFYWLDSTQQFWMKNHDKNDMISYYAALFHWQNRTDCKPISDETTRYYLKRGGWDKTQLNKWDSLSGSHFYFGIII